jgi:threonine synthase
MSFATHLQCIRCRREYPLEPVLFQCPACATETPSNVRCVYDYDRLARAWSPEAMAGRPTSMWRYAEFFPVDPALAVTLGEGMTPLICLPRLGRRLGLETLYLKDESQNPTWSFKDRMASVGATKAVELGTDTLAAASSGNGGAATGAYAARAGLRAVILTMTAMPASMYALMRAYGSLVLATASAADRGPLVRHGVEEHGWFPIQNFLDPPVGANAFAQEGCKAIGLEICEQLGWVAPDAIVLPITLADSLVGALRGFADLHALGIVERLPRMVGAELFGPLERSLAAGGDELLPVDGRPTVAVSTASRSTAYQALDAVRASGGTSVAARDDAEVLEMQSLLAEEEGIFAEASGALSLVAVARLARAGALGPGEVVVAVNTSGGLKDFDLTAGERREIPLIEPTVDGLEAGLLEHYGYRTERAPI